MAKYLYEVSLTRGRSNPKYELFFRNVTNLNAKQPDFGGINNVCIVSHHMDAVTVQMLCSEGLRQNRNDVTVTEITKESLDSPSGHHRLFLDLIENYFLPYDDYPNVK
jgi:hypothetical protein